jgi:hypothetical protein
MRLTKVAVAGVAGAIMVASASVELSAQIPGPPPAAVHGCLRTNVAKTTEVLRQATEKGAPQGEVREVQEERKGCTSYTITFQSALNIVSHGTPGGTRKISGRGVITFGLAPDPSEPDFELTSGPGELTAPVFWSDAEITLGNGCIVKTVALPYTAFSFWLGVKSGPDPKLAVQVVPAGDEAHLTRTRCPNPTGGYTPEMPGREMIFTPAWSSMHASMGGTAGAGAITPPADPAKMKEMLTQKPPAGGLDLKKLEEMAARFKDTPPTAENMGDIGKLMREVVPDADRLVDAARDNFKFKMPGDCVTASPTLVRCTITRPSVTVPDNLGSTQTITESTVITIIRGATAKP